MKRVLFFHGKKFLEERYLNTVPGVGDSINFYHEPISKQYIGKKPIIPKQTHTTYLVRKRVFDLREEKPHIQLFLEMVDPAPEVHLDETISVSSTFPMSIC